MLSWYPLLTEVCLCICLGCPIPFHCREIRPFKIDRLFAVRNGKDASGLFLGGFFPHAAWLEAGADPNLSAPLYSAAYFDRTEAAKLLIEAGADPLALLGRTSKAILPWVGEHLVYPKTHRPEAILLSVSGNHSLNQGRPPSEPIRAGARVPRPRVLATTSSPALIILENRPSPASPPPSLPEALREAFPIEYEPGSIRILRRGANGTFESILGWQTKPVDTFPTEWPALEWGDILDVRNSSGGKAGLPRILDFAAQISSRTVTYRLGELEFPKTIPLYETFWLDRNSCVTILSLIPPRIGELANLNQFVVHRKGFPEPINLDFTEPTETRFRLLDGDTAEMSWDTAKINQSLGETPSNRVISLVQDVKSERHIEMNLVDILLSNSIVPAVDYRKVCILRRTEKWKPEVVNFQAWLEQLPPIEEWEKEALIASTPKLNLRRC